MQAITHAEGADRDEREYVISHHTSTGGIQRFKAGNNGGAHTLGAMIGYVQEETTGFWNSRIANWIGELAASGQPGWTAKDLLRLEREDTASRFAVLQSSHDRQNDLAAIDLRHFWMEMN